MVYGKSELGEGINQDQDRGGVIIRLKLGEPFYSGSDATLTIIPE